VSDKTDLLPLPWIERYAVVGDIAYPVSSDPDGDYVAHDDHTDAMQAYARACVSSATEALRAEVELWRHKAAIHKYRRERLAEALRGLLNDTQHKDHNCGDAEWCPVIAARAALEQETTNG
jgi:hypothetical protein